MGENCAGHDDLVVAAAKANDVDIDIRSDDEFGTSQNGDPRRFGIEDRAGPQQRPIAQLVGHRFEHPMGFGNRERNLDTLDAAGDERLGDVGQEFRPLGAQNGDGAGAANPFKIGRFVAHGV